VHLVTRLHFRSRDKDGGHNIRWRCSRMPHSHADVTAQCFVGSYCRPKFYIAGTVDLFDSCDLDLDRMTFIYEVNLYLLETHRMCRNERST